MLRNQQTCNNVQIPTGCWVNLPSWCTSKLDCIIAAVCRVVPRLSQYPGSQYHARQNKTDSKFVENQ